MPAHVSDAITTSMLYAANDTETGLGDLELGRNLIPLAGWRMRVQFVKIEISDCPCGDCPVAVEVNAAGNVLVPDGTPLVENHPGEGVNVPVPAALRPPWLKQLVDRTVPGLTAGLAAARAHLPHEETS